MRTKSSHKSVKLCESIQCNVAVKIVAERMARMASPKYL